MDKLINKFLTDNSAKGKLLRTIVQGILAVLSTKLVVILGLLKISPEWQAIIVPIFMAIFSPIMAELGAYTDTIKENTE